MKVSPWRQYALVMFLCVLLLNVIPQAGYASVAISHRMTHTLLSQASAQRSKTSSSRDAVYCQCGTYVDRYVNGNIGSFAQASELISLLPQKGWHQEPWGFLRVGDIAVWDGSFAPPYGHTAVVADISGYGNRINVTFKGTNQTGSWFRELNCSNVSYWNDSGSGWRRAHYFYH
ncbi:CHAP domain-containing protein [Ktedonobacter racemifer]|uniref:Peptidase C51 domain-containing protein n=1 Tax=Ktedonobacter racemifer DSM 44963 TaxID=485913 RepID=D6TRS7_KTERA|nr:CHAP domain-containing protein [Ktedonobacter racemifer]EFH86029.1 hypothetical protein Krac_7295 [Ktedonobacter racemifer DSM 44963]